MLEPKEVGETMGLDGGKPVVEEEVAAKAGSRVDVDCKDVGDARLEGEGEGPMVLEPKEVGDTVGMDGEEAYSQGGGHG